MLTLSYYKFIVIFELYKFSLSLLQWQKNQLTKKTKNSK